MSFNMAAYQNVANVEKENRDARQVAMKKAGENQAETQEFKVDKINEFQKAAEKASRRFGLGRIGGMAGGILLSALVPGLGTAAAMMIGSGLGGAIGKNEAKRALGKSDYFARTKDKMKTTMTKGIISDTIMAGLMGGTMAQGVKDASSIGGRFKAMGETLVNPTKMGQVTGGKSMFDQILGNTSTIETDSQGIY